MKYSIKNKDIAIYNETSTYDFPKYTTQLLNLANQNAQGTRPVVVGQLSDLFPEFLSSEKDVSLKNWLSWYIAKKPNAFEEATEKINKQLQNLQRALSLIDHDMIKRYVEDLVVNKTYNGLYVQKAILASLANKTGTTYRLATPEEESQGIDGFIGDIPYSIKPDSYKTMSRLSEVIDVKMIYYTKTKTGLKVEIEE